MFIARQSTLRSLATCPRRTFHELQRQADVTAGFTGDSADLGIVVHVAYFKGWNTLWSSGQDQISTHDMDEITFEALADSKLVLSAQSQADLFWICRRFCEIKWQPQRIISLERQYEMEIVCPDGVVRKFTGRPDYVQSDPGRPPGVLCIDPKSGLAKPRSPQQPPPEGEPIVGREYLSERGAYQGTVYAALLMENIPMAEYCIFREWHLRSGEFREIRIERADVPHIKREIGIALMNLDQALQEGESSPFWKPRSGRHCYKACPVTKSCPIPEEQRGLGSFGDVADVDRQAARYAVVDALRTQLRDGLKAYYEETGHAPAAPDGRVLRWAANKSGGRSFGWAEPEGADYAFDEEAVP